MYLFSALVKAPPHPSGPRNEPGHAKPALALSRVPPPLLHVKITLGFTDFRLRPDILEQRLAIDIEHEVPAGPEPSRDRFRHPQQVLFAWNMIDNAPLRADQVHRLR